MRLRIFVLWLLALTFAYSNGIVAWNHSISGYAESGPKRKLGAPPEPSVFFKQGDVLYNVMPQHSPAEDLPDWLIWNETSGLLVAKGNWRSIYLLADELRMDKLPLAVRIVFDLFEPSETGDVPADATPACSFSAVTGGGKKFILEQTNGPWKIKAEGEPYISQRDTQGRFYIRAKLNLNVTKDDQSLEVDTNVISPPMGSMRLARGFRDGHGIQVRVSFRLLLPDGREPIDEIFEEKDGKALRLNRAEQPQTKTAAGYSQSLSFFPAMSGVVPQDNRDDAFVNPEKGNDFPQLGFDQPLVNFPADTDAWIGRPLLSLGELPESLGLIAKPDEKVGYDPLRDQLHFFAKDEGRLHMLYVSFLSPEYHSKNIAVTRIGQSESSVTIQSGQRGTISYRNGKNEPPDSLEAEVILGEDERKIHVDLEMSHGSPKNTIRSNVFLWDGSQTPIGSVMMKGEKETSWSLKAEILLQEDHP